LKYDDVRTTIVVGSRGYLVYAFSIARFNLHTFTTEVEMPVQAERPEKAVFEKDMLYLWSDTTVVVYDIGKMMAVRRVDLQPEFMKREQDFMVSPNGKTFVIASRYGVIEFFDAITGKSKAVLFPLAGGAGDYILIDKNFQWTGTAFASENMMHLKSGNTVLSPRDVAKYRTRKLLKALLVD